MALSAEDRADRFTGTVSDEVVQDYVGAIGYARDVLVGALQERRLVGLAHAAVYLERGELVCEVGVSVDAAARRGGLGQRLLRAAIAGARRFQVRRVIVLFRSANRAMAALTRKLGGRIEREYGLGRGRTDLLVIWPYSNSAEGGVQRFPAAEGPGLRGARRDPGRMLEDWPQPDGEELGIERIDLGQL